MSMESLQKAADAAGWAMVAYEDEPGESRMPPARETAEMPSRAVVAYAPAARSWVPAETLAQASGWIKGHLPSYFGGRATA